MKTLLLLAVTMAIGLLQVHGTMADFQKMIKFTTGKEPLTSYGFYGCHCGAGSRGTPKDATDWCCRAHDCCYENLKKRGCRTTFQSYNFIFQRGQIVCGDQDFCKRRLCQCDKTAADCLDRNRRTYNKNLQYYNNLLCFGSAPKC
ncbi:phospholipase A2, membrane associated-like [Odocoileus virginianus]|uniref:Phospholipase A2 n=1 Tax=Odocoileus virginianus TaxID=9874 RepID=A0A6J0Y037_ODOVR|nr:phospholipase A2, membrane associated-like [Odocoileus virginianus texanus]